MSEINWLERINGNPIPWLLEEDRDNPGPRWFTLVNVLETPGDAPEALSARRAIMESGPVSAILAAALIDLDWLADERLRGALDWLARSITGQGIAPAEERDAPARYYKSGNCAPGFACAANAGLPCAWGAVKAALALGKVPPAQRTPEIERAIAAAREFLLSAPPAQAGYPSGYSTKPSRSWFQFGYPLAYVTDVLQNLEALTLLGCAGDPRVRAGVDFVLSKQDGQDRWTMEYSYNGKTWADIEQKGRPSKWVTLRALRVVKRVYG